MGENRGEHGGGVAVDGNCGCTCSGLVTDTTSLWPWTAYLTSLDFSHQSSLSNRSKYKHFLTPEPPVTPHSLLGPEFLNTNPDPLPPAQSSFPTSLPIYVL